MYTKFIESELKKWKRDPMMRFMFLYPILFGFIGRYFVPWVDEIAAFSISAFYDVILVGFALVTPQMYGALMGFSILEDRDDHIFDAIRVSPLGIDGFFSLKIGMLFLISWLATIFVIVFSNLVDLAVIDLIIISFLAALTGPIVGLLINGLASNKIEGFAVMKGLGVLIFIPVLALFFYGQKELFFAVAPGFWPAKAISSLIRGEGSLFLSYTQYILLGLVYLVILNGLTYKLIKRKLVM